MTDRLEIEAPPPEPLVQIEVWGDLGAVERRLGASLPKAGRSTTLNGARVMWWEPKVWLVRLPSSSPPPSFLPCEAGEEKRGPSAALAEVLADDGAAIDVAGAFSRLQITGADWRELLMIGGVFDAESPTFGPDCIAGTVIHHLPVRLDVIDPQTVDAYTPPSYAAELAHHWRAAARRMASAGG